METTSETARKKAKVNEDSKNTNITLPEEIVIDIISRLPVKQIFQLQCLSKNFSSITKDLHFIGAHLEHSARRLCPSVILNKRNEIYLIKSNGIDSETIVEEVPLHRIIDLTHSIEKLVIKASCNGLVILSVDDRDSFICNPASIQCNKLPNPSSVEGMHFWSAEWGIGYCTKSSQYKIVRLACYTDEIIWNGNNILVAEVLSYCTNSKWRRLDFSQFDLKCECDGPGIYVKGFVYWALWNDIDGRLLSFDLEKEEFGLITCPFGPCQKIMEFHGSLAVCVPSHTYGISSYDIYVLKDASNVDSWKKVCNTGDIFRSTPVGFLNDHQLFLIDKCVYARSGEDKVEFSCSLYDLERGDIKRIPQALASYSSNVLNFVESMVPLLT